MSDLVKANFSVSSLEEALKVGKILAASGYFKDVQNEQKAIAKILAGIELGIGAIAALQGIYLVDGKLSLSAGLIASLIKRSNRYNYLVEVSTDKLCVIEFFELFNGQWKSIGKSSFSEDEARKAGLLSKQNWQKYPLDMLFARAVSRGARQFCPDVFSGSVYSEGEIETDSAIAVEVQQPLPKLQLAPQIPVPVKPILPAAAEKADDQPWKSWKSEADAIDWAIEATGFDREFLSQEWKDLIPDENGKKAEKWVRKINEVFVAF